jgi:1-acyl-sn-glycerol-3-phosphate acyltransferase
MSKKKKPQKIGKPAAWLYHPAFLIVSLYYRLHYRVHIYNSELKSMPKGGCVVLATHTSNKDHFLTAMALYPRRVTFVMSEHFFAGKLLRPILKIMNAIPKKMFCPDTRSVLSMIRAIREGNTLLLFPEGRLTCNGKSCPITPGTAELIHNLGVPVYTITAEGAGKTFPKWAKKPRIGRIDVHLSKLFDGPELKEMHLDDIDRKITDAISHNAWESLPDVKFKSKAPAEGLDGILWRCPECGAEHTLICENNTIICQNCSLSATVDAHGQITGVHGIKTVADWYEQNASTLDLDSPLTSECIVGVTDGDPKKDGVMRRDVGKGKMSLSSEGFTFDGEINGEETHIALLGKDTPGALPISVADHFDVYYGGKLHFFTPLPDPRDTVKFVAFKDKLNEYSK